MFWKKQKSNIICYGTYTRCYERMIKNVKQTKEE